MRIPVQLEDGDLNGASVCLCVADSSNTLNKMTQSTELMKNKTKHQTTDSGVNLTLLSYRYKFTLLHPSGSTVHTYTLRTRKFMLP